MEVDEATDTFFAVEAVPVWVENCRCFETVSAAHVLAWLWLDLARKHVMVITCVPRTDA